MISKSMAGDLENCNKEVPLQDENEEIVVVGSDVCSLYPSLDTVSSAAIARHAVQTSPVEIKDINYEAALVYFLLQGGEGYLRKAGLGNRIPLWLGKRKDLLRITGKSALNLDMWKFRNVGLTSVEKKVIASLVIESAVVTIMMTHVYKFSDKYYLQDNGGPIGLNSTCSLSSVVMCWWDKMWVRLLQKLLVKVLL